MNTESLKVFLTTQKRYFLFGDTEWGVMYKTVKYREFWDCPKIDTLINK